MSTPQPPQSPQSPAVGVVSRWASVVPDPDAAPARVRQLQVLTLVIGGFVMAQGILNTVYQPSSEYGSVAVGSSLFGLVFSLLFTAGVTALVYVPLVRGKNWGRYMGLVVSIFGLISSMGVLSVGAGIGFAFDMVWGLVQIVIGLVLMGLIILWIVWAFSGVSKSFYKPVLVPIEPQLSRYP